MIEKLNKNFDSRVRIGVMALLVVHEWLDFNTIKEELDLTDGNLASHIAALEKNEYIVVDKKFVGKKPRTSFKATRLGKKEFQQHLNALEAIIRASG